MDVGSAASYGEIKKAWREKAKSCHPDKFQDEQSKRTAHGQFIKIAEAYSVLIDEAKRREYDEEIRQRSMAAQKAQYTESATTKTGPQYTWQTKYQGYQQANPSEDKKEVDELYKEIFSESAWDFVKHSIRSILEGKPTRIKVARFRGDKVIDEVVRFYFAFSEM